MKKKKLNIAIYCVIVAALAVKNTYAVNKEPDASQWELLLSIAQQTTLTGGPGVYNARAMTQWEQDDDANGARNIGDENSASTILEMPNPTSGKINLEYYVPEKSNAEIKIYNVLGVVISTIRLDAGDNILSSELKNNYGNILFYRFYVDDILIDKGKIIYIK